MHKFSLTIMWSVLLVLPALQGQTFQEVSQVAGISGRAVDPALMSGGIVWFDYNNDRYPDLLLLNGTRATRLYRNDWDGSFTDVSESTGLLNVAGTMGAASGDFDNDGFADLFITTMDGAPNVLLRNEGGQSFRNVSVSGNITETAYSASATTGDYDGDGDLDIYVSNYLAGTVPEEGGLPNFLYRNDGNFHFTEVAAALQLDDRGCGLGATFSDFNNDGRPDLYVANDYGYAIEPNAYFQNDSASFSRKENRNGTAATINAMGIAKGDYDNDGDQDLYVTNIRENPLFENTDDGQFFSFRSFDAGVALPELTSWGTAFSDVDLDGYLDLVVANGEVAETVNEAEPQRFYHNDGNGTFTDASEPSGIGAVSTMGRGLAVADYNLDGFPDIAINAVQADLTDTENATLLKNQGVGEHHWLAVETPVSALKISLYAGAQSWHREVDGGSGYLSHSAVPVHFGAPSSAAAIDSLVVTFTDQSAQLYSGLNWDQLTGIRADGSWYVIGHEFNIRCGAVAADPVLDVHSLTDPAQPELLLITRTETVLYPQLEEQIVELSMGELYRGLARTQDAVLVDTIAGDGPCPGLRPVRINVLPSITEPVVYPNPITSDHLSLQLPEGSGLLRAKFLSSAGAHIFEYSEILPPGQRTISLPIPSLPRGTYLLSLEYSGKTTHHKIIRP